jgi:intracellular sulfur oxidation DsrE/DsrF family protein
VKARSYRLLAAMALALGTQLATTGAIAAGFDDHAALGDAKDVKVAFDITTGDAKALLGRLKVIEETRQSLIHQGVTPHFLLAFRGPATKLIQTDASKIAPKDRAIAAQIAAQLKALRGAPGIDDLQQCSVAVREQGTKAENVDAGVTVVGNAWISLMAYENRGYAYIAP